VPRPRRAARPDRPGARDIGIERAAGQQENQQSRSATPPRARPGAARVEGEIRAKGSNTQTEADRRLDATEARRRREHTGRPRGRQKRTRKTNPILLGTGKGASRTAFDWSVPVVTESSRSAGRSSAPIRRARGTPSARSSRRSKHCQRTHQRLRRVRHGAGECRAGAFPEAAARARGWIAGRGRRGHRRCRTGRPTRSNARSRGFSTRKRGGGRRREAQCLPLLTAGQVPFEPASSLPPPPTRGGQEGREMLALGSPGVRQGPFELMENVAEVWPVAGRERQLIEGAASHRGHGESSGGASRAPRIDDAAVPAKAMEDAHSLEIATSPAASATFRVCRVIGQGRPICGDHWGTSHRTSA